MIIFDTETTGLPKPVASPLEKQPKIIEFAAIKLDDNTMEEVSRIEFMCNPGHILDPKITEITKITDEDLKDKKSFSFYYNDLVNFFIGERYLIAHNVSFDVQLLQYELMRLGKLINFPWPPRHICTVLQTMNIKGYRLKLSDLHNHLGHGEFVAHRAMSDVEALTKCVISLCKDKLITL